ncbi:MAG: hypothetical protein H7319_08865 [Spirosoma sp.]|nr:hypothetical protein [Spirosoma sp.]
MPNAFFCSFMRLTALLTIVGSLIVLALTGCENCGPTAEPLLNLSINTGTQARPDTIFSPDSRNPLPARPSPTYGIQSGLPVNLTADSTRYVYRLAGRYDTVTVFYQRKTAYRNRKCGYVLDLYEPERGPKARTSRGKVESVSYLPNRNANFLSSSENTSIYLSIRL